MRVCVATLLFLSLVFGTVARGGADALPTAAEIEAKSDAAYGPPPKNYRETIVGTGTLGAIKTVTYRSGDNVRHVRDRGPFHSEYGTFEKERWHQNYNGLTIADVDDPGKAVADTLTRTVTRVSTPFDAYVVSELNVRRAGTRTYYDPTTYRTLREDDVDSTGTVVTTYSDFQSFGARTLPTKWTTTSRESAFTIDYQRTEYVPGGATDHDVAEPRTRRALVEFPNAQPVVLPTQFDGKSIYVRVRIGEKVGDFALDTGASTIVIDPTFAKSAGLTLSNASTNFVAHRTIDYKTSIPEVHIGTLTMHDIVADATALDFGSDNGIKLVGLLGFDFLAQLGVTIDYEHQRVTAVVADRYVPPADPATYDFPIRIGHGVPMITAQVGSAVAERIFCDTGWDGQLAFMDYFARRYPQAFTQKLGPVERIGVGGAFTADVFRFHEVTLGTLHLLDFVGLRIPESSYPNDADGVIGNELLSLFSLGLDYTHGHIYLTPNAATKRAMHKD